MSTFGSSDHGADGYGREAAGGITRATDYYDRIGHVGDANYDWYMGGDAADARKRTKDALAYLDKPLGTDTADAAELEKMGKGSIGAYLQARAHAANVAAQSGGGADNGWYQGNIAALDAGYAGQQGANHFALADARMRQHRQNIMDAAALSDQLAGTEYGRGYQGDSAAAGGFLSASDRWRAMQQDALARQQAEEAQSAGIMGGLINTGATLYGMGAFGGPGGPKPPAPKVPTPTMPGGTQNYSPASGPSPNEIEYYLPSEATTYNMPAGTSNDDLYGYMLNDRDWSGGYRYDPILDRQVPARSRGVGAI